MSSVPTSSITQPHRTMTSNLGRAHTGPAPKGFLRSVMRHRVVGDLDDGLVMLSRPEKKATQEEQDAEDEKARKRAMRNLVNSWQERLQLISVITTFFASTEAAMLVNSKPANENDLASNILQVSNASLLGALIVHVYASVLSFMGAFLLISYKLKEARREEMIAEGVTMVNPPLGGSEDVERDATGLGIQQTFTNTDAQSMTDNYGTEPKENRRSGRSPARPPVISANPHIEEDGPFMLNVSSHLLQRTHVLCVLLAAMGFVLAIIGIMCYSWSLHPTAVSIFVSTCMGVSVFALIILFV